MSSPEQFGGLLAKHLARSGLSQAEFAKKCGISAGQPTNFISGRRTPPPEKIPLMIQALGLDGEEADIFRKAAGISHVPDPLRKDLAATARTIADLQRQVETAHMARRVAHAERHALKTRPASEILKASGLDPDAYERAVLAPDRSLDSLPALAAAFGVDLAFLLTGQPAPDWYKSGGFSAHS